MTRRPVNLKRNCLPLYNERKHNLWLITDSHILDWPA